MMKCANGFLEDDSLIVAFAVSLGLDAVVTRWLAFITLDPALTTSFSETLGHKSRSQYSREARVNKEEG